MIAIARFKAVLCCCGIISVLRNESRVLLSKVSGYNSPSYRTLIFPEFDKFCQKAFQISQ